MATKKESTAEAAVLMDCGFGLVGEVVNLPVADIEIGVANGMLDTSPEAVKAARKSAPENK